MLSLEELSESLEELELEEESDEESNDDDDGWRQNQMPGAVSSLESVLPQDVWRLAPLGCKVHRMHGVWRLWDANLKRAGIMRGAWRLPWQLVQCKLVVIDGQP